MSKRRRYEVWFRDEPRYMVLRASTLASMIKTGSHRHTPMVGYSRLRDGEAARGEGDPLMARMRQVWADRQNS